MTYNIVYCQCFFDFRSDLSRDQSGKLELSNITLHGLFTPHLVYLTVPLPGIYTCLQLLLHLFKQSLYNNYGYLCCLLSINKIHFTYNNFLMLFICLFSSLLNFWSIMCPYKKANVLRFFALKSILPYSTFMALVLVTYILAILLNLEFAS